MPKKCSDPGMFSIPCIIGETKIDKAMLDLGASINVLGSSLNKSLKLPPLQDTKLVIQLVDGTNVYLKGVIEDVLVMVDKLIFPTDFYVLDMGSGAGTPMLLGRPFMKTANTTINVTSGKLTMEFDGDVVEYNIYDMKLIHETSLCNINVINPKPLDTLKSNTEESIVDLHVDIIQSTNLQEVTALLVEKGKSSPSFLGSRPSVLTPQGQKPLSSCVQGRE